MPEASHPVTYVDIDLLKPHEQVKEKKAAHYQRIAARQRRMLAKPILADRDTYVILDGHHRYFVCKELGIRTVPCVLVDYLHDAAITVLPRRKEITVSKEEVIRRGLAGELYPHKTTKHVFHLPEMETLVDYKRTQKMPDPR